MAKTQFLLTGFSQIEGFRVFEFECVREDRSRLAYTVRADLALLRRYDIQVQELPLLCRRLLEQAPTDATTRSLVFTEASMREHSLAAAREREELRRRRGHRKSPVPQPGVGWRAGPN